MGYKQWFGLVLVALLGLSSPKGIYAQGEQTGKHWRTGEIVTIGADEVINGNYLVAGETVYVYGTINGDLYVAGAQVIIDGQVNGDVWAAGGNVTLSGDVSEDLVMAGGQLSVTGQVGDDMRVGGGSIDISPEASISGSLVGGAGQLMARGSVGDELIVGVGNLLIDNSVGSDVMAGVGAMTLGPNARVGGDVLYWSEENVKTTSGTQVTGETVKHTIPEKWSKDSQRARDEWRAKSMQAGYGLWFMSLLCFLVISLTSAWLFPGLLQTVSTRLDKHIGESVVWGIVSLLLTPAIVLVLALTVIGFPLAMIILMLYVLALYLAKLFVLVWGGRRLLELINWKSTLWLSVTVGTIVYYVLLLIPIIGGLVKLVTVVLGLGILIMALYNSRKKKAGN